MNIRPSWVSPEDAAIYYGFANGRQALEAIDRHNARACSEGERLDTRRIGSSVRIRREHLDRLLTERRRTA